MSQVPVYGANHAAPVVIAFPAAAPSVSAPPLFDAAAATNMPTGNNAADLASAVAAAEARRHERENYYADVDLENNSMRGRYQSIETTNIKISLSINLYTQVKNRLHCKRMI